MARWWEARQMAGFDLETTGADPELDEPVQYAMVRVEPHQPERVSISTAIVEPVRDIHPEATKIHGITREIARERGEDPLSTHMGYVAALGHELARGVPVVGMNISFDLTIMDRQSRRYPCRTLADFMRPANEHDTGGSGGAFILPIIDVYVLDKYVDQYRPGRRNLQALCEQYRVPHNGAHDAAQDVLATLRVAWRIGRLTQCNSADLMRLYGGRGDQVERIVARLRELADLTLEQLHHRQVVWRAEQCKSLQTHFRRTNKDAVVDPSWPIKPWGNPDESKSRFRQEAIT